MVYVEKGVIIDNGGDSFDDGPIRILNQRAEADDLYKLSSISLTYNRTLLLQMASEAPAPTATRSDPAAPAPSTEPFQFGAPAPFSFGFSGPVAAPAPAPSSEPFQFGAPAPFSFGSSGPVAAPSAEPFQSPAPISFGSAGKVPAPMPSQPGFSFGSSTQASVPASSHSVAAPEKYSGSSLQPTGAANITASSSACNSSQFARDSIRSLMDILKVHPKKRYHVVFNGEQVVSMQCLKSLGLDYPRLMRLSFGADQTSQMADFETIIGAMKTIGTLMDPTTFDQALKKDFGASLYDQDEWEDLIWSTTGNKDWNPLSEFTAELLSRVAFSVFEKDEDIRVLPCVCHDGKFQIVLPKDVAFRILLQVLGNVFEDPPSNISNLLRKVEEHMSIFYLGAKVIETINPFGAPSEASLSTYQTTVEPELLEVSIPLGSREQQVHCPPPWGLHQDYHQQQQFRQRQLDFQNKQLELEKYKVEKQAEVEKYKADKQAEAEKYKADKQAEKDRAQTDAKRETEMAQNAAKAQTDLAMGLAELHSASQAKSDAANAQGFKKLSESFKEELRGMETRMKNVVTDTVGKGTSEVKDYLEMRLTMIAD